MKTLTAREYATLGAGLVAVAFGLARYAYGLFVPAIREELGLSPDIVGLIGSLAFMSFVLASLVAHWLTARVGARRAAMTASGLALAGLFLMHRAPGPAVLATGVFICGVSTGLMMPALSAGVQAVVPANLQGRVNAVMNAGTSIGLLVCVPALWVADGAWRTVYAVFAALAAAGLVVAWRRLPAVSRVTSDEDAAVPGLDRGQLAALLRLTVFGAATGVASAAYWIFAPDLARTVGGLEGNATALLWFVVGATGLAGAWASDLADRIGAGVTQALALVGLAVSMVLLASAPGELAVAVASAAVFGWAFMTLSGLYLVSGVRLLPRRPSLGPVVPFLAITVGQAVGSPLVGWTIGRVGHIEAFAAFAALSLVLAACSPLYPMTRSAHWTPAAA